MNTQKVYVDYPISDKQKKYLIDLCKKTGRAVPANVDKLTWQEAKGVITELEDAMTRLEMQQQPQQQKAQSVVPEFNGARFGMCYNQAMEDMRRLSGYTAKDIIARVIFHWEVARDAEREIKGD